MDNNAEDETPGTRTAEETETLDDIGNDISSSTKSATVNSTAVDMENSVVDIDNTVVDTDNKGVRVESTGVGIETPVLQEIFHKSKKMKMKMMTQAK